MIKMARVRTVGGDIDPEELGVTLMHEHLLVRNPWLMKPKDEEKRALAEAQVSMNIRGCLWRDGNICADNLLLDSKSDAVLEVLAYKKAGGTSLVDVTSTGLGRDVRGVVEISRNSGLNIVCGTGWYLDFVFPPHIRNTTAESLSQQMIKELTEGIGEGQTRAGVIGEIGCSYPWTNDEKKVLEAASMAQVRTGAPIDIHSAIHDVQNKRLLKPVGEYLDFLLTKDANPDRVYVSHMDFTSDDTRYHRSIIDKYGVVLGYDGFGQESYWDSLYPGCGGVSDKTRVETLVDLMRSGYERYLVVSHDICAKMSLRKYGGHGYSHIL